MNSQLKTVQSIKKKLEDQILRQQTEKEEEKARQEAEEALAKKKAAKIAKELEKARARGVEKAAKALREEADHEDEDDDDQDRPHFKQLEVSVKQFGEWAQGAPGGLGPHGTLATPSPGSPEPILQSVLHCSHCLR